MTFNATMLLKLQSLCQFSIKTYILPRFGNSGMLVMKCRPKWTTFMQEYLQYWRSNGHLKTNHKPIYAPTMMHIEGVPILPSNKQLTSMQ